MRIGARHLAILLAMTANLRAYTYPDVVRGGGQLIRGNGAKSVAMGSSGVTFSGEPLSGFFNPAGLGWLLRPEAQLAGGMVPVSERVVSTVTGEVPQAFFNGSLHGEFHGAAAAYPFKFGKIGGDGQPENIFAVALGARPIFTFAYDHSINRLDADGAKIGSKHVTGRGQIYGIGAAIAGKFKTVSVGLAFETWTRPTRRIEVKTVTDATSQSPETATSTLTSSKFKSGYTLTFGLAAEITKNLRFGAAIVAPVRVKTDDTTTTRVSTGGATISEVATSTSTTTQIPYQLRAGLSVHMPDFANSSAHFEAVFTNSDRAWVQTADSEITRGPVLAGQRDTIEIRLGAEHWLTDDLALRYGYRFEPWFGNREVNGAFFSAGAGYRVSDRVQLDVAGEFGKRNYRFLDANERFFTKDQRVDETPRRLLFQVRTFF